MQLLDALREGLASTPTAGRPAGIEVRQELSPAAGLPVQPPSYEGRIEIHGRSIDGQIREVIELDSVGSSANRLEDALLELHRDGTYSLPVSSTTVEPGGDDAPIEISTLEMPHRVFDAWLRLADGDDGATPFERTPLGQELSLAHMRALDPLLEVSAHDLLLGAWDSHRKGPNGQVRIARSFTSSVIGLDPIPQAQFAARRDPLNLGEASDLPKGAKRLSEEGLSSVPPQKQVPFDPTRTERAQTKDGGSHRGGVAITSARFLGYLAFSSLRRLGFARYDATDVRVMLAALCLYALVLRDAAGWDLRARCSLVPESDLQFALVRPGGQREPFVLGLDEARSLFEDCVGAVGIKDRSVRLNAGSRLNDLVAKAVEQSRKDS